MVLGRRRDSRCDYWGDRPFLLGAPIEYVLTFPPDLTKALKPLRVRFFGKVLRCERVPSGSKSFCIAVWSADHPYVGDEQSASFDAIEKKLLEASSSQAAIQPRETGT